MFLQLFCPFISRFQRWTVDVFFSFFRYFTAKMDVIDSWANWDAIIIRVRLYSYACVCVKCIFFLLCASMRVYVYYVRSLLQVLVVYFFVTFSFVDMFFFFFFHWFSILHFFLTDTFYIAFSHHFIFSFFLHIF